MSVRVCRVLYSMHTFPLMNCQWNIFDRAESTKQQGHEQQSLVEEVVADLADLPLMLFYLI